MRKHQFVVAWIVTLALSACIAFAGGGTELTYQGRLLDAGEPANGTFNVDFSLWDDPAAGSQVGSTITFNSLPITDGLFTVELDFGANAFDNTDRWLEVVVNGTELTPRQPVTRSPYSIQTRGIVVDQNLSVGIGTSTPVSALHVVSDDAVAALIDNSSIADNAIGLRAILSSDKPGDAAAAVRAEVHNTGFNGIGVWASHDGSGSGVRGTSVGGIGVSGYASGTTGINNGVFGRSDSSEGRGVTGFAVSNSGINSGVYGVSTSGIGRGVYGEAQSGGAGIGVHGSSNGFNGRGVYGHLSTTEGFGYGVIGQSDATGGTGVFGYASSPRTPTFTVGVRGESNTVAGYDFFAAGAGEDYGSASSIRWKSSVRNIDQPLDKIARLRGVYFDWDKEHGGHHDVGMIAEEVGEVLPEIVNYEENGIDAIGMDYSKLTPLLVEAVNALRSQRDSDIASLHAENDDLRDENAALRDRLDSLEKIVQHLATNEKETSK